jgi:signal transduction histidine kinase
VAFHTERTITRPDGSSITVVATMAPARAADRTIRAWVGAYTDITDRKTAELALAARAAELERANRDLADANQLKSDLMAMLTHEIAQPLGVIVGYSDLLATDPDGPSDDRYDFTQKINMAGRRLSRMVSDMLLMFRLETHALTAQPQSFDLAALVDEMLAELAPTGDIRAALAPGVTVHADPDHVRQILTNLVTNGRKYGAPPVEIHAARTADRATVVVRDHGRGVPAQFVPHLFSRFTRSEAVNTAPGIGLGLYITKQLVEANHGTISYQPAAPHGAAFCVELPAVATAADRRPAPGRASARQRTHPA